VKNKRPGICNVTRTDT